MTVPDRIVDGEERWHTIGLIGGTVVLLVAHAYAAVEDELVRIISARRATRAERRKYEQNRQGIDPSD